MKFFFGDSIYSIRFFIIFNMYSVLQKKLSNSLESKFASSAKKYNKKGELIISLGLGEPSFSTPKRVISKSNWAMLKGYTRYSNPKGLQKLRNKRIFRFWIWYFLNLLRIWIKFNIKYNDENIRIGIKINRISYIKYIIPRTVIQ